MDRPFIVGTRTSRLALWQTRHVVEMLCAAWEGLECRIKEFTTKGDKTPDKPLPDIGGKGLFTLELEEALRGAEIDAAVHSLKDLPVEDAPGLTLGAVAARAEAGDCLVARSGWTLETLPEGAVVGTSSTRRRAQLLSKRPDLQVRSIRGNVETRIRKVMDGQYDATVLARAGLERLELTNHVTDHLGLDVMLPAPGQGALAVQCRADDRRAMKLLSEIDDPSTRAAVSAERTFLAGLGGGCATPVGAFARTSRKSPPWRLTLSAVVGSIDGRRMIRLERSGDDPASLGKAAAEEALQRGGADVLAVKVAAEGAPLGGRRVVVTRAGDQAEAFCKKLEAAGAEPVLVPVIRIVPAGDRGAIERAIAGFREFDWAVFTSANGVTHWWNVLAEHGLDRAIFGGARVAAVGSATAGALRERGVEPDFIPEMYVGEQIARGLEDVEGKTVCLLRARMAGGDLPRLLRSRGARVVDVAVYENVPAEIEPEAVAALRRGVDIVTFTSGSTVRNFVAALRSIPDLENTLGGLRCACIGPVTAKAARELNLDVRAVASVHTVDGLFEALVSYFDKEKTR
jgi:hydroxymethylbilane synthase